MSAVTLRPGRLCGEVEAPPSKSAAHRAILCAALAALCGPGGAESVLSPVSLSQDIEATIGAARALGVRIAVEGDRCTVSGGALPQGEVQIDCGESGSTLRFLIPVAAALGVPAAFTGRGRLPERPIGIYTDLLPRHGVSCRTAGGLPFSISGRLQPGVFELPGNVSSQFITGLLLALPLLPGDGESEIVITDSLESKGYVDMTLSVLQQFGVQAENVDGTYTRFRVPAGQQYHAGQFSVEGDYSQAAFFLAYNAAAGEEAVRLHGLSPDSVQGDKAAAEILSLYQNDGDLTVDASGIPDLIPSLAMAAAFRPAGRVIFANAGRLRLKESDRLATTHQLLRSLGAEAETGEDFLAVTGTGGLPGGGIADCCNDHRIAMSGAVAAALSENGAVLLGTECVGKSYPAFWEDFASLGGRAETIALEN